MKEIISSLSTSLERLYQGFVLRDLLGFILPGSIFLLSVWSLFAPSGSSALCNSVSTPLECFSKTLETEWKTLQIAAFIGGSYLVASLLQSFHYGLVDIIYQIATKNRPILGLSYYMKGISTPFNIAEDAPELSEIPSLMSIGALAPEKALQNLKNAKALTRFQESKAYSERISVLQIVIGNSVLAGIPFLLLLLKSLGKWTIVSTIIIILGLIVLIFGFVEHWRLFFVRNLRHEILVKVANAIKDEDIASSKNEHPPEITN